LPEAHPVGPALTVIASPGVWTPLFLRSGSDRCRKQATALMENWPTRVRGQCVQWLVKFSEERARLLFRLTRVLPEADIGSGEFRLDHVGAA